MKAPYVPPLLVGQMCDCYMDETRKAYSVNRVNKLSDNESKAMGQMLIIKCNIKTIDNII